MPEKAGLFLKTRRTNNTLSRSTQKKCSEPPKQEKGKREYRRASKNVKMAQNEMKQKIRASQNNKHPDVQPANTRVASTIAPIPKNTGTKPTIVAVKPVRLF